MGAVEPFKILIVGGSYSGLACAVQLLDLTSGRSPGTSEKDPSGHSCIPIEITIIDERDGYFHLLGSPLTLASLEYAEKAWNKFEHIPALQHPCIRLVQGSVTSLDTGAKLANVVIQDGRDSRAVAYDFLVAASGLRRPPPAAPQSSSRTDYLKEISGRLDEITNAPHGVLVVGGGAVGIEIASELKLHHPKLKVVLAHSRDRLLSSEDLPDEFKEQALQLLRGLGVEVLLGHRAVDIDAAADEVMFTNGYRLVISTILKATSRPVPSTSFFPNGVVDAEGYVCIRPSLFINTAEDMENADFHLAIGDVARWSGIRRFGRAKQMGDLAAHNIYQKMQALRTENKPGEGRHVPVMKELPFLPPRIALAVGDKVVMYGETGVVRVDSIMNTSHGPDLAFTTCWNMLQLGKKRG